MPKSFLIELTQVGQWWGTDAKTKKEMQIDIIGTSTNKNEFIIGSCKYRSRPIDTDEFELLQQYASAVSRK